MASLSEEQTEKIIDLLVGELDDAYSADAAALIGIAEVIGLEVVHEEQTYQDGSARNQPVAIRRRVIS